MTLIERLVYFAYHCTDQQLTTLLGNVDDAHYTFMDLMRDVELGGGNNILAGQRLMNYF